MNYDRSHCLAAMDTLLVPRHLYASQLCPSWWAETECDLPVVHKILVNPTLPFLVK